ncbi:MAG TPA: DUF5984 family protein [Gallionellaceae bacterium]
MLINFKLAPLDTIAASAKPGQPGLNWFALTEGEYWIELGESTLFEYSEGTWPDGRRHCRYKVARLHEDLMGMLPSILEPVPASLVPYLSGERAAACWEAWTSWCDRHAGELGEGHALELEEALLALTSGRQHLAGYLAQPTRFVSWSDETNVHFAWDNRHDTMHGQQLWTAQYGQFHLARRDFIEEVQTFHTRLMDQMAERVEQVLAGALSPEIRIDIDYLVREQARRYEAFHDALNQEAQTNWQIVEAAIEEIMAPAVVR